MTTRSTAAIAAGALAVGMLTGVAGAIVVGNATVDSALDRHYEQMGSMMGMMGGADRGAMMDDGRLDDGRARRDGTRVVATRCPSPEREPVSRRGMAVA